MNAEREGEERKELVVIGAGPAGLSAAIEAARAGVEVCVVDENHAPGGQLFKQIHKFFGSQDHYAQVRGFDIGTRLLAEAKERGVDIRLDTLCYGLFRDRVLGLIQGDRAVTCGAEAIIVATGAMENTLPFPGWTLPGVMGAGAAQTMVNSHRVLPGRRVIMVGSGNVGLIVSYQLLQAGAEVVAVVEAAPRIGGYGVHAGKIRRAGVPILVSTTVKEARGTSRVEDVTLVRLGEDWSQVPGTERVVRADTVCMAVGLTPLAELLWMAGAEFGYSGPLGGHMPLHGDCMQTTLPGVYVAGDITGIEEASSAMEEGRLAATAAAWALGHLEEAEAQERMETIRRRLSWLRSGPFGTVRRREKERLVEQVTQKVGGIRCEP